MPKPTRINCKCGTPAPHLYVLQRDINAGMQAKHARDARLVNEVCVTYTITELMDSVVPIPWRVACDDCIPEEHEADGAYVIPQPKSWQEWAAWSAHLLGKEWLPESTWDNLLYAAGCEST